MAHVGDLGDVKDEGGAIPGQHQVHEPVLEGMPPTARCGAVAAVVGVEQEHWLGRVGVRVVTLNVGVRVVANDMLLHPKPPAVANPVCSIPVCVWDVCVGICVGEPWWVRRCAGQLLLLLHVRKQGIDGGVLGKGTVGGVVLHC